MCSTSQILSVSHSLTYVSIPSCVLVTRGKKHVNMKLTRDSGKSPFRKRARKKICSLCAHPEGVEPNYCISSQLSQSLPSSLHCSQYQEKGKWCKITLPQLKWT